MRYRLYVDEAGDHTRCLYDDASLGSRYLGLIGVWMPFGASYVTFARELEDLKRRHFTYDPDDPPILHRTDIQNRRGPFGVLTDPARRQRFDDDLVDLIRRTPFTTIAVVVDKLTHGEAGYRRLWHPYSYALLAMLERYCGWLKRRGHSSDLLAESRGGAEDLEFKRAYTEFWESGHGPFLTRSDAQRTLTSKHAKLRKKEENLAGLQFADILAHPLTRDVLVSVGRIAGRGGPFADRIADVVIQDKYNRHWYRQDDPIRGYGRVFLS